MQHNATCCVSPGQTRRSKVSSKLELIVLRYLRVLESGTTFNKLLSHFMEVFTDKLLVIRSITGNGEATEHQATSNQLWLGAQPCLHWWRITSQRLRGGTSSVSVNTIRNSINFEGGFPSPYSFLSSPNRFLRMYQNISAATSDHSSVYT